MCFNVPVLSVLPGGLGEPGGSVVVVVLGGGGGGLSDVIGGRVVDDDVIPGGDVVSVACDAMFVVTS